MLLAMKESEQGNWAARNATGRLLVRIRMADTQNMCFDQKIQKMFTSSVVDLVEPVGGKGYVVPKHGSDSNRVVNNQILWRHIMASRGYSLWVFNFKGFWELFKVDCNKN